MTVYTAYFDASGSADEHEVLCVGGYVATNESWLLFENEWKQAIMNTGLPENTVFHMKNFTVSTQAFAPLKSKNKIRDRLMKSLVSIIQKRVRRSFAQSVLLEPYRRVDKSYGGLLSGIARPFPLAARTCIATMGHWARSQGIDPLEIHSIFEDGDKDKGQFIEIMDRDQQRSPSFGKKPEYVPLQAADFIAWEHLKINRQLERKEYKGMRGSLRAVFENVKHDWGVYEERDLIKLCETVKWMDKPDEMQFG